MKLTFNQKRSLGLVLLVGALIFHAGHLFEWNPFGRYGAIGRTISSLAVFWFFIVLGPSFMEEMRARRSAIDRVKGITESNRKRNEKWIERLAVATVTLMPFFVGPIHTIVEGKTAQNSDWVFAAVFAVVSFTLFRRLHRIWSAHLGQNVGEERK